VPLAREGRIAIMEQIAAILAVSGFFAFCLGGFYYTKLKGFGKFNSSLLIFLVVLYVATIAVLTGKAEWPSLSNLLFAIAGFAGGLIRPDLTKSKPEGELN
jgi:drug/metabolite transporter (DMT)-like permease